MRGSLILALLLASFTAAPSFAQENEEQALVVARRAAERFRDGEYERAAMLLGEAIALHETSALHYNLAQTLLELERWNDARGAYERYLALEPESALRPEVELALADIERRVAREAQDRADAEEETEEEERAQEAVRAATAARAAEAHSPSPAPWLIAGAGVLVAAGGIPFLVLSNNAVSRSREAPSQRDAGPPADDAKRLIVIADILFAVGATATTAGLIWGLTRRTNSQAPSLSLRPHGAGLAVEGSF